MEVLKKFTPMNIMIAYRDNKDLIRCYIAKRRGQTVEGYEDKPLDPDEKTIMGVGVGVFLVLLMLFIALYIWAVILLVHHGKTMPTWAFVLSICLLLLFGPLFPIIIVYVTKDTKEDN